MKFTKMSTSITKISTAFMLVALNVAIVSCSGQDSDPLKNYEDVKAVPAHDEVSPDQTTAEQPFTIVYEGPNEINYANFNEGKPNKINVRVIPRAQYADDISDHVLKLISEDSTDLPTLKKTSPYIYELSWTPRPGTIAKGSVVRTVSFELLATVSSAKDARFNGLTTTQTMFINVTKEVNKVPIIAGITGWKNTATEGEVISLQIRIEDPNYKDIGIGQPKLNWYSSVTSNVEAYNGDSKEFIRIVNPTTAQPNPAYNGGGNSFTYFLKLRLIDLPEFINRKENVDTNAKEIEICTDFQAYSVTTTPSTTKQECVTVKYNAQPAVLTLDASSADKKIYAGKEQQVSFTLSTENGLSTIIKLDSSNLKGILTASDMVCEDTNDGKGTVKCQFKWAPKCLAARSVKQYPNIRKVTVPFKLKSTLNKIIKTSDSANEFEVIDTEENCKPAAVQPTAATDNKITTGNNAEKSK